MKRPKFFEDLDRSLAGEPEPEPEETPSAPIAIVHDLAAKGRAIRAEEDLLRALGVSGIDVATATGAMIMASQQRQALDAWYYERARQATTPKIIYGPFDCQRITPEPARARVWLRPYLRLFRGENNAD